MPTDSPRSIVTFRSPDHDAPSSERPRIAHDAPQKQSVREDDSPRAATAAATPPADPWRVWGNRIVALWLTGVLVGLAYIGTGIVAARRLLRRTLPVRDAAWLADLGELSARSRIAGVALVSIERLDVPGGVGMAAPCALWCLERAFPGVPKGGGACCYMSWRTVSRGDWWWQMLSNVVVAVWWFHPLAWLAALQPAQDERRGGRRFRGHLWAGAGPLCRRAAVDRQFAGTVALAGALAGHVSQSAARGAAAPILDPRRNRRLLSRRWSLVTLIVAVAAIVPLATLTPTRISGGASRGQSYAAGTSQDRRVGKGRSC